MKEENENSKLTPEEEAKAQRAIYILYGVMFLFIVTPFVLMIFLK